MLINNIAESIFIWIWKRERESEWALEWVKKNKIKFPFTNQMRHISIFIGFFYCLHSIKNKEFESKKE